MYLCVCVSTFKPLREVLSSSYLSCSVEGHYNEENQGIIYLHLRKIKLKIEEERGSKDSYKMRFCKIC